MASNVPLGQVRDVVISYLIGKCREGTTTGVAGLIERWGGLISSLTGDQVDAMRDCILRSQVVVAEEKGGNPVDVGFFLRLLKGFYEQDVVSEEAVLEWYKSAESRNVAGEAGKKLWTGAKPFVEWLMQEDESDEEEEDSD